MSLYVHEIRAVARLALINDSSLSPKAKLERILREHVLSLCQNSNYIASLDQYLVHVPRSGQFQKVGRPAALV